MKEKVRVGIAGCGWITSKAHIPALKCLGNVEIVSVFDIKQDRLGSTAEEFNIKGKFTDYNKFLDSGLDSVVIATPNHTHAEYCKKALEKGRHVLCEKPVAMCSSEVGDIITAARKSGKLFIPAFVNRFRNDIMTMHSLAENGEIGYITGIKAGWIRRAGMPRPGTWFTNKELSGGGVLIDIGSHIIDICMLFIRSAMPIQADLMTWYNKNCDEAAADWFKSDEKVFLPLNVENTVIGNIKFSMGIDMTVELSWSAPVENDYTYFILKGTKGSMYLKTLFGFSNNRLWEEDTLEIRSQNSGVKNIKFNKAENSTQLAFSDMMKYFVRCVGCGKNEGFLTDEDGLRNISLIEKLYKNENKQDSDISNYIKKVCQHE